jgi:hypothetical protein
MAFDFKSFTRFTCLALFKNRGTNYRLTPRRAGWLLLFYTLFPLLELAAWIGFTLDEILFRAYRRQEIRRPVFLIGNPRSGTTFLYHLLARDRDTFTCMRTWELFFAPSVALRKVCKALAALDRRLGRPLRKQLAAWEARCQERIPMHRLGMHVPEEDEYLLLHIWSNLLIWEFSAILEGAIPLTYFDRAMPEAGKKRVMAFYRRGLQRHLYAHGIDGQPARHYLSKNPSFCPKVGTLCEWFPDARFIYLVRNPLDVVPSYINSLNYGWRLLGDPVEGRSSRDFVLDMAGHWYRYPLERLERLPPDRFVVVKLEDLSANLEQTVAGIYRRLGFEISPSFARVLQQEAARSRRHRSKHQYSLQQTGIARQQIVATYRDVFDRFGFDTREDKVVFTTETPRARRADEY